MASRFGGISKTAGLPTIQSERWDTHSHGPWAMAHGNSPMSNNSPHHLNGMTSGLGSPTRTHSYQTLPLGQTLCRLRWFRRFWHPTHPISAFEPTPACRKPHWTISSSDEGSPANSSASGTGTSGSSFGWDIGCPMMMGPIRFKMKDPRRWMIFSIL